LKRKRVTRLDILGKPWTYEYLKESSLDAENFGTTTYRKLTVAILEDLPLSLEQDVFLHETIHAIDASLGLCMTENQVNQLGCALAQVVRDNPDLLHYLAQR
jgi:hypothetical protein